MRLCVILLIATSAMSGRYAGSNGALAHADDTAVVAAENIPNTPQDSRELVVGPRIPINPPDAGYPGEVMMAADPEADDNLIVCGYRANLRTGSEYEGYVYQSSDGGKTWREALVDAQSQWVSEESCTFGPGHQAYFVTGVSDTSRGEPHHEYGSLHLYRSADGGRTWQSVLVNRFLDFTSMTVDATLGPGRGTLYIFANALVDGTSGGWSMMDKAPYLATLRERSDLSFSITSGSFNSGEVGVKFPGKYPGASAVLSDGTALAIFPGDRTVIDRKSGRENQLFSVEIGSSQDGGKTLNKSTVYESVDPPVATGLAVNDVADEIYVCWTPRFGKSVESNLTLAISRDKGRTWSVKTVKAPQDRPLDVRVGSMSLAAGRNGILGFMWYGKTADRVYFGASFDDGDSLAKVIQLNPDSSTSAAHEGAQADDRRLFVIPPVWNDSSHLLEPLRILLFGPNPWGVPFGNALVVDRKGVFHPAWSEVANGATHLWTRAVSFQTPDAVLSVPTTNGLMSVSDRIVCHVSDVKYDYLANLVAFDLTVTNKSEATIEGPILVVLKGQGGQPELRADNADNGERGDGALWELQVPAEGLLSEHSTAPRTMSFRTSVKREEIMTENRLLEIPVEVYGKPLDK